ncbi:MAG: UDP-N-acetylglucosamine 2-epimerase [Parcubacteria group bacterium Athens0714_26]|nr:MAG: UDP-N-acetylglucosamine 2-epimerase [Parcubacteria group bacterium Athens0714_26]
MAIKKKSKKKFKAVIIVGARPNFMKASPLIRAMNSDGGIFESILLHTGQHYDSLMNDVFFKDLDLPKPLFFLGVGSGTHIQQIAKSMLALEETLVKIKADLVIVVGDVNSTLAGALAAKKLSIPLVHVEAGLRSFDEAMPEEINRTLTDRMANFLFTTEESANRNLVKEGVNPQKIHFVGNTMIDSLHYHMPQISKSFILNKLSLDKNNYAVLTMHRPSNVDNKNHFLNIFEALYSIQKKITIVFPVHPRTRKQMEELGFEKKFKNLKNLVLIEPLGYIDFMKLVSDSRLVFTDSGGLQEETTTLGIPCITLRENTERPVTVEVGTNVIVGTDAQKIIQEAQSVFDGKFKKGRIPQHWDGKTALRIIGILSEKMI